MKNSFVVCALITAMGASISAHAADSATLIVSGTINVPSCDITMPQGALTFEPVAFKDIAAEGMTLPSKTTAFTVLCAGKTTAKVQFVDAYKVQLTQPLFAKPQNFALVKADNTFGGMYTINIQDAKVDANSGQLISVYSNIAAAPTDSMPALSDGIAQFNSTGQEFSANLVVTPTLMKPTSAAGATTLKGETTLKMVYF